MNANTRLWMQAQMDELESFHVVYLNDNYGAYGSEDIKAQDKAEATNIAHERCPMGPCGLLRVYSQNEWAEVLAKH